MTTSGDLPRRLSVAGRFVDVDGVRIHVVDEGHGAPVLLMAALGSNWFDLDPVAARLVRRGRRVIRYDRPGYGLSDLPGRDYVPTLAGEVDRMRRILAEVGEERPVVVVGHSLASLYVEGFARAHPERTAALVILDGSHVMVPWRLVPPAFRVANAHRAVDAARIVVAHLRFRIRGRAAIRERILPTPPEGFDERQWFWANRVFGRAAMVLATLVENASFPTVNADLRRLRRRAGLPAVPIVVVAALNGPQWWRRYWQWKQGRFARLLGARLAVLDSRHFVVLERPDEVAQIIGSTFEEPTPSSGDDARRAPPD